MASGSKDNTVRLWDPREARQLATLHGHKNTVLDLKWNMNGNWLLTCGKDQLIKLYDIRKLEELYIFKGHKKDITSLAWHPTLENMFVSGGFDGAMYFWYAGMMATEGSASGGGSHSGFPSISGGIEGAIGGTEGKLCLPMSTMDTAHEGAIWSLDWHPVGHILVSGSNDHSTRFWTRSRPCDLLDEKETRLVSGSSLLSASTFTSEDAGSRASSNITSMTGPGNGFQENTGRTYHRPPLSVPSHFQQAKRKRENEV